MAPPKDVSRRPHANDEEHGRAFDERMFNKVVTPHLDDAYRFARWLTGDAADAEDVVQESCLRAMKGLAKHSGHSGRAWLIAIVRNTAFTWLARNRPRDLVLVDDLESAETSSADAPRAESPEATLIAQADAALLQKGLDELPAPFREVLVMREFNDMSYREIAEAIDAPIGTVMSRLARARALLIERIGKELS
jgi:RNA polymerase sigma-70 factor (ECF subfamily)